MQACRRRVDTPPPANQTPPGRRHARTSGTRAPGAGNLSLCSRCRRPLGWRLCARPAGRTISILACRTSLVGIAVAVATRLSSELRSLRPSHQTRVPSPPSPASASRSAPQSAVRRAPSSGAPSAFCSRRSPGVDERLGLHTRVPPIALFVLVLSVYAASSRLRQRRPDVEALKKLAAALAGLVPLVFVIGFLAMHRNSELWGAADMMMGFASIAAIERFHAVLDAWKILVGKAPNETLERLAEARSDEPEMTALPPESPEAKKVEQSLVRARVEVRKASAKNLLRLRRRQTRTSQPKPASRTSRCRGLAAVPTRIFGKSPGCRLRPRDRRAQRAKAKRKRRP